MGTPVEEKGITPPEGETEEVPGGDGGEQSDAATGNEVDDKWSIKDVPLDLRPHVEKAIKPFHSRTTKAEQKVSSLEKKIQELETMAKGSEEYKTQLDAVKQDAFRLLTDNRYREVVRNKYGYSGGDSQDKALPEGWNDPSAVQARQLLFNEVVSGIENTYGVKLADLPKLARAAQTVDSLVVDNAHEEIEQTKGSVTKEGLPWDDDILDACISVVGRYSKSGNKISLREAYNKVIMPAVEAERKKQASTDIKIKEKLPFKPSGKGNETHLTGDNLLRNVINDLGLPGSFED